jgi:GNAT superfamily N-acetyltransferase
MLEILPLAADEIPLLKDFPPPDWKVDLPAVFRTHFGQPYFHPLAAKWDRALIGCANALVHADAGWLGNIIVLLEWRGRGIGKALTQRLIAYLQQNGVRHQILVATSMGEPVYRKLGFERVSDYVFFERTSGPPAPEGHSRVRRYESADEQAVLSLDDAATREKRDAFLRPFLDDVWVHVSASGSVDGFFLPRLGTGPVIALADEAGLALMQHKLSLGAQACVVPDGNQPAMDYLLSQGFIETSRAPRMALGGDVDSQPRMVYCRGAGYCG